MDENARKRMDEEAELQAFATSLRQAVAKFNHGELLSAYVILEKLGVAPNSTALEGIRHRTTVRIYREELMRRLRRDS